MTKPDYRTISPKYMDQHVGNLIFLNMFYWQRKRGAKGTLEEIESEEANYGVRKSDGSIEPILHGDAVRLKREGGRGFAGFGDYIFLDSSD